MTDLKILQLMAIFTDLRDWGEKRLEVDPPPAEAKIFEEMLIVIQNARIQEATSTEKIRKIEDIMAFDLGTMPESMFRTILEEIQKILRRNEKVKI